MARGSLWSQRWEKKQAAAFTLPSCGGATKQVLVLELNRWLLRSRRKIFQISLLNAWASDK